MWKTRERLSPLTVRRLAPGPVIVRFLLIASSPDARWIANAPTPRPLNVMKSVAHASAIAWRRLPAPLSFVVVTTGVAGHMLTLCAVVPELVSDAPSPA